MKGFIVLLICIVAVFGEKRKISENEKKMEEFTKECIQEMKLDSSSLLDGEGNVIDVRLYKNPCFLACLDKKMGMMNEDGTYNLEGMLFYAETPEDRKKAESVYNNKIKECSSKIGKNDACKMAGCAHKVDEPVDVKNE